MAKKNKSRSTKVKVSMTSTPKSVEFNPDYAHIKKDLTRIGTLAGAFIVLMVVLSFFVK